MVKGIQKAHESTKARTKNAVARAPLAGVCTADSWMALVALPCP